jgi:hypothetical protein
MATEDPKEVATPAGSENVGTGVTAMLAGAAERASALDAGAGEDSSNATAAVTTTAATRVLLATFR